MREQRFVSVMTEKSFYTRPEKTAEKLGTTPDVLISNALLPIVKKLEEKWEAKNERSYSLLLYDPCW